MEAKPWDDRPVIRTTGDGSPTLFSPHFNTTYHSIHGAVKESEHVFLLQGLQFWLSRHRQASELRIFEMGLGTGLNAMLSCHHTADNGVSVHYQAWEKYPLPRSVWQAITFPTPMKELFDPWMTSLHEASWDTPIFLSPSFALTKRYADLLTDRPAGPFDVVYYDAFGPETQPELWTTEVLGYICDQLDSGGVFVTYCAKGDVRRSLCSLGLEVHRLPGPPGKREMLRAIKS